MGNLRNATTKPPRPLHPVRRLAGGALLALSVTAHAGYWPTADTSEWSCQLCPEKARLDGRVTGGLGSVSDASDKFGAYTGLDDSGAHLIADADLTYRDEAGGILAAKIDDAGLETRQLSVDYGRPGRYGLTLGYERLPTFVAEGARTVFRQADRQTLALPDDWQTATSTRSMTQLLPRLTGLPPGAERERLGLGAHARRGNHWQYGVNYKRIEQDGDRLQGAGFLTNAVILPVPLNRVTDQVDANLTYLSEDWQVQLTYHGSLFDNRIEAVVWDNPFSPLGEGGDRGRLSQEPDNRFHQLMVSGHWQAFPALHTSGRVALGQAEQDAAFLPATINPVIGEVPQPATSLDGQVDTVNGHARAQLRPNDSVTLTGEAYYDERDNNTASRLWNPVRSDLAPALARFNRPFGFERTGGKLRLDVTARPLLRLSAGASREEMARDFGQGAPQETGTTHYWGEVRASRDNLELSLHSGSEDRRFVKNGAFPIDLTPPENPLLRRFNLGERDRRRNRVRLTYTPTEPVSLSLSLDQADDDYQQTRIGLTRAEDRSQSIDISASPKDDLSLYGFFTRQVIESQQSSSERQATPDWNGRTEDTLYTAGAGLKWLNVLEKLDLGLDVSRSDGRSEMQVTTAPSLSAFPPLRSDFDRVEMYGTYRLNERLSLRLDYWYEKLRTEDFFIDDVSPDTLPNLLSLGQQSPDYSVHVVGLSATYRF